MQSASAKTGAEKELKGVFAERSRRMMDHSWNPVVPKEPTTRGPPSRDLEDTTGMVFNATNTKGQPGDHPFMRVGV